MRAIQIVMDDDLLAELDATEEVKRQGRSAVLRRAAAAYLAQRREAEIRERYRLAYAAEGGLGAEVSGWEEQGAWPPE